MSGVSKNPAGESGARRLVVLTGGPGSGKTAVLEVLRRHFGGRIAIVPEAASILFSGGFPRRPTFLGRRAAQRAISRVARELERLALEEGPAPVAVCDRGTIDGLAYWPGDAEDFWRDLGSSLSAELARYSLVVHLRTPTAHNGYNHANPVRTESPDEAAAIDARILEAWSAHPRRCVIESTERFMDKVARAVTVVRDELVLAGEEIRT